MSHSDSTLKHFNPAANSLVIAGLVLSAAYVGWQLKPTPSTSEASADIVANQVSASAGPSESETAGSENSNAADDARNSGAVQTTVSISPALKKPLQRARLSKATLLLQQRANATKNVVDAEPAKQGLVLFNNDEGAEAVTLMLDDSVRKIAIDGELRLNGDGPWAVRFIQGNRFVSNEGSLNAGTYRLQKAGAGWRLQMIDDSKSN